MGPLPEINALIVMMDIKTIIAIVSSFICYPYIHSLINAAKAIAPVTTDNGLATHNRPIVMAVIDRNVMVFIGFVSLVLISAYSMIVRFQQPTAFPSLDLNTFPLRIDSAFQSVLCNTQ